MQEHIEKQTAYMLVVGQIDESLNITEKANYTNFYFEERDENGNVMRQPAFLENGTPNPKAGKVMRHNMKPNLEQFFINKDIQENNVEYMHIEFPKSTNEIRFTGSYNIKPNLEQFFIK